MDGGKRLHVLTRAALGVGLALLAAVAVCGVGLCLVEAARTEAFLDSLAPDGTGE